MKAAYPIQPRPSALTLRCPQTGQLLERAKDGTGYLTTDHRISYPEKKGVVDFLLKEDGFYEGAYLNKIRYVPTGEQGISAWPLWLINSGYLWQVRKHFPPGARLLELGCASGVNYFAQRYHMVGLDLSLRSLESLEGYEWAIRADALHLPFPDETFDGVISSYFWEHVTAEQKEKMLKEFQRVLRPKGKLVFLYDVETDNSWFRRLKQQDPARYQQLFLEQDQHLGYESPTRNQQHFEQAGYRLLRHEGMEKTLLQSTSVYEKLQKQSGGVGTLARFLFRITRPGFVAKLYLLLLRLVDASLGPWLPAKNARIILTVAQKQ